jgi:putative membrane protein
MKRVELKGIPLRANRFAGWSSGFHRIFFGLFVIQFALVWMRLWMSQPLFGNGRWPDGLLVVLAAGTTLASQARHLPGQNVMLASIIIAFIAGAVESLGALTGIPFGPFTYTTNIGQELFHPLPWAMPLVWIVVLLNARGVGRLILRPWRKERNYGLWLIGVASLLVVLLDLGLEPFATCIKRYWLWSVSKTSLKWYSAPWVNFVGWAATALIILAFTTPSLINKAPSKPPPAADWFPLVVWLMLNTLLATAALSNRLWPAAVVVIVGNVIVAAFAGWGGKG